ncbi:hypothetical protein NECID01_0657 [Nematocida sp. AWRm77]|nr:hypothetical protein NECID01_0657 [Nematocida sp. AWRm77]
MDPPIMDITSDRFATVWEQFQEEANKLASGIPCSGMVMYYAVYQIVSSNNISYAVQLHWCIGKFFFSLAMRLQERISGPAWVGEYAKAFCIFEKTVEIIDMLAQHLNEAIVENKECRQVKELGYIIWERCVLRYRYDHNLPLLYEALPQHREHAAVCLRSLEKILTNTTDPLEYYRNNYETGLISAAVAEFKRKVGMYTGKNLPQHLSKCGEHIQNIVSMYQPLLLTPSFPILETALEKSIFSGTSTELGLEIKEILNRGNCEEIKVLCLSLSALKKQIFSVFLEEVRVFSASQWPQGDDCQSISRMHKHLSALLAPTSCPRTLKVLLDTLSVHIGRPGVGLRLSAYLETIIQNEAKEDLKTFEVLLQSIGIKEEKSLFYHSYITKLTQRLLSLSFTPSAERMAVVALNLPWMLKRKVRHIFDDIVQSSNENRVFCANHGSPNFNYPLLNNVVFFYAVVTTASMWPIPEESIYSFALPQTLLPILSAFEGQYLANHARRKLLWASTLSMVTIEVETDKTYSIEMPLLYYAVLEKVLESPLNLDKVSSSTGMGTSLALSILENLHSKGVLVKAQNTYSFNNGFSSDTSELLIQMEDVSLKRTGNRKPYYQAWISKHLKTLGRADLDELGRKSMESHTKLFEWNLTEYSDALANLKERGFIEIEGNTVIYIP